MYKMSKKLKELAPYALHLAMVVAVAVYVVLGAFAIRHIEASPKTQPAPLARLKRDHPTAHEIRRFSVNRTRKCIINAIEKINRINNCSDIEDGSYLEIIDDCYEHDIKRIFEKIKQRKNEPLKIEEKAEQEQPLQIIEGEYEYWSIMDSVLFCFTVITTIGYGNVAPRSFHGRLFVILYGLIGVPFTMLALANLGKFLATVLKTWTKPFVNCIRKFGRRCCQRRNYTSKEKQRLMEKESKQPNKILDDDSEDGEAEPPDEPEDATTDGLILFLSFVIYIVVGSIVIAAYEPNMDFFEAIYFNFVTLTTIGLGDLVPQSETYLAITLIYCAIGLALTTIAIEIAADALKKLHYFGRKVDNVANIQVWFGGKKISMKALVKNLGDQFNVPVDELEKLNIDKFVDDAMKVEQGELATLRQNRDWMNSNYWKAIESGSMHYVDDDDLVTLRSNRYSEECLIHLPSSHSFYPNLEISSYAPCVPTPTEPSHYYLKVFEESPIDVVERPNILELRNSLNSIIIVPNDISYQKSSKLGLHSKWSEEARRRYEQYQQTWKRFRTTAKENKN